MNKRIGMAYFEQYIAERTAYEFGYGFQCLPETRVCTGKPQTEGDCHPITEAGWFIERYIQLRHFSSDSIISRYIMLDTDGEITEGIGMVVDKTSATWIPKGRVVFAIVTEYSKSKGEWLPAINPF